MNRVQFTEALLLIAKKMFSEMKIHKKTKLKESHPKIFKSELKTVCVHVAVKLLLEIVFEKW